MLMLIKLPLGMPDCTKFDKQHVIGVWSEYVEKFWATFENCGQNLRIIGRFTLQLNTKWPSLTSRLNKILDACHP